MSSRISGMHPTPQHAVGEKTFLFGENNMATISS